MSLLLLVVLFVLGRYLYGTRAPEYNEFPSVKELKNMRLVKIDRLALYRDSGAENEALVPEYCRYILSRLYWKGTLTADDLYDGEILDIPLYLALHDLCWRGIIQGPDPYAYDCPVFHTEMVYSLPA